MKENRFSELDKQMTKEIMPEFKGKLIAHMCPDCQGDGEVSRPIFREGIDTGGDVFIKCENCDGTGEIKIQY